MIPQKKAIKGLYAVTPDTADTARLQSMTAAAIRGGAGIVQYRNKTASPALRHTQAQALLDVCNQLGAMLLINDHVDLAVEIGAHGAHIGGDDGSLEQARKCLGDSRVIGVSCYKELARAEAAAEGGADYIAFGSFYASSVKPSACTRAVVPAERCPRIRSADRGDRRHYTGQCGCADRCRCRRCRCHFRTVFGAGHCCGSEKFLSIV